jgi:hypothetical protein
LERERKVHMITALTQRLPIRITALLAIAILTAALTAALAYSTSAPHAVSGNGVIAEGGVLTDR